MSRWTQVWLLAKREFVERGRTKPFIVTMTLLSIAILAIGPVTKALSDDEPAATVVGLVGVQLEGIEDELIAQGELFAVEIDVEDLDSMADAEVLLEEGDVDVVLADGDEVVYYDRVSGSLTALIQRSVDAVATRSTLTSFGLNETEIESLDNPVPVSVSTVDDLDLQEETQRGAAFLGSIVLYVSIIMFGQFVAMGTVEEKQNRVVEIVLARVRPWQILVGKVAGIGLLGLVQLVILVAAAYVSASLSDLADIELGAIGLPIILGVFFWFILGYTFYAFLYAAVGSTVSRQEDLQGAIMLPIGVILPGYLLAIAAAQNADSTIVRIGSMTPMWAPFVMPVRIAADSAVLWEVAVAVVGSILGAVALVWIGSRVYRGALIRTGSKVKLRDAWRAAGE